MTLFDPPAVAIARQAGIDAATAHADKMWKRDAYWALEYIATWVYEYLTADEVWQELADSYPNAHTHQPSAMGGVFTRACSNELIVKANRLPQRTKIPIRHRDLTVWRSLVYVGDVIPLVNGNGQAPSPRLPTRRPGAQRRRPADSPVSNARPPLHVR